MSLRTMSIGSCTHNEGAFSSSRRSIQLRCLLKECKLMPASGGSADSSLSTACLKVAARLCKLPNSCLESSPSLEVGWSATYRDSSSPRAIASPDALIAKSYMWEWYVIVGRSLRFERLVNSTFPSDDDEAQEFVLRGFVVASPLNAWAHCRTIRHRRVCRRDRAYNLHHSLSWRMVSAR